MNPTVQASHARRAVAALVIGWHVAAGAAGCGVDDLNVSEGTPSKKDGSAGTDSSSSVSGGGTGGSSASGGGGSGALGPNNGGAGAGGVVPADAASGGGPARDAQSDSQIGPDGTAPTDGGAADSCNVPNALKCAGPAQKVVLICDQTTGKWRALQSCDGNKLCDTRTGATFGSCQEPDPLCLGKRPGDKVCSGDSVYACGPDLIDRTLSTDCQGATPACLGGACVACTPSATPSHCNGSTPQFCNSSGRWEDSAAGACASSTPACLNGTCGTCTPNPIPTECEGNTPRFCDTNGAFASKPACTNPNPECVNGTCVECHLPAPALLCSGTTPRTCQADGSWKNGTGCGGATPVCRDGACVECVPNPVPTRCSSGTPQYCDSTGHWANAAAACGGATAVCLNGACVACTPNNTPTQCFGTDTPQFCNSSGAWENKTPCTGNTPVCMAGSCVDCTPSVYLTHCSATGVPQFCDTSGHWKDGPTCPSQTPECSGGICKCSGVQCGASCYVDDPANCGFCGHSCQGAACTGGFCDVTVLASNQNQPSGLSIVNPSYVYWTTTGGTRSTVGTLNRVAISTGVVTELAGGLSYPTDVLAAGGSVYFTELGSSTGQGKVSKWTAVGQPIEVLATGQTDPISLAWNSSNLNIYWGNDVTGASGASVFRFTGSPPPVTINPYPSRPFRMFVANPNIYWIQNGGGAIAVSPLTGGTMGVAVSTASGTKGVSLNGVQAYVTVTGGVWRYPLNSSAPAAKSIAAGQSSPYGITTDASAVYWTNEGDGTVMRNGLDGGIPHVLARNQTSPGNIVVGTTHVFWVNRSSSGSVMKVAK